MADVYTPEFYSKNLHMAEFGNAWADTYTATVTASIADKVYFGVIPAGTDIDFVRIINEAAASATLSLGYEPIDDSPTANTTAFFSAQSIGTAGAVISTAFPVRFERPVRLVATVAGAAISAKKIVVSVKGRAVGAK